MKKSVLYVFAILLAFTCCSKHEIDDYDIIGNIYQEWGVTIPYQDISKSETYHLLENLINYIDKNQVHLITFPSSDLNYPYLTMFNKYLGESKEAITFFKREDCVSILISTYLISIKTKKFLKMDSEFWGNKFFTFLEYVLKSEICMSVLNVKEKVHLMILALERIKFNNPYSSTFGIMISIMLSSNYTPFINDVNDSYPMFIECLRTGACFDYAMNADHEKSDHFTENLVIGNAKQFINDNK